MAIVSTTRKSCTINPLRMSQPIGAALAFMGVDAAMPLLHGSQGCTSFGLVLFVRHFRESIPMQTTAMSEVATILGGYENVEKAVQNIVKRTGASLIGICSTGVTEMKGDDIAGYIRQIREQHPELANVALVHVSTPDYRDAFQDGWAKAVTRMVEELVLRTPIDAERLARQINVLPGSHLTPGDLDELRDIFDGFGLEARILPDISGSLDGHLPDDFTPTTLGGISTAEIATMGRSAFTIAIGEQMRPAAEALQARTGVPYHLFDRLTGLTPSDALAALLARLSGKPVPHRLRRQRGQLVDAMLDAHFYFGGKRVAIGAEPDLLWNLAHWFTEMGCTVDAAVTTTHSPLLEAMPTERVLIGDLHDLEQNASGSDLLVTHSHGRQAAERLGKPLFRIGIPMFDRIGAAHLTTLGYRGTRDLTFAIGNVFLSEAHEPDIDTWRRSPGATNHGDPAVSHPEPRGAAHSLETVGG